MTIRHAYQEPLVGDVIVKGCRDCGEPFELDASAQRFFNTRGLMLPNRCTECRRARRQQRDAEK